MPTLPQLRRNDFQGELEFLRIRRPSNFHAHFRWAALMRAVTRYILMHMRYVVAMPNNGAGGVLKGIPEAESYWRTLRGVAGPALQHAEVLMTLYNSEEITPETIAQISRSAIVRAIKCYPAEAGATTGSGHGIPLECVADDVLRAAIDHNVRYLVHGEVTRDHNNNLLEPAQRERYYMREILPRVRDKHPNLLICVEHGSTTEAVEFVKSDKSGMTAMTVCPQHLLFTHRDFNSTWGNHLKCMPILKEERDRLDLLEFAGSGDSRVIAGTDTAPHPSEMKAGPLGEAANGCCPGDAVALYVHGFERGGKLRDGGINFERFVSLNGPDWWGLKRPDDNNTVVIRRGPAIDSLKPIPIPGTDDEVIPLGRSPDGKHFDAGFVTMSQSGF